MKRLTFLMLLCVLASFVTAQNWSLYPKNQESVFNYNIGEKILINEYKLSSAKLQNQTIFFFNDTLIKKLDIEQAFTIDHYGRDLFLLKQFNQEELIAYYIVNGDTMHFYNYNLFDWQINEAFAFVPTTPVGESWKTGETNIECKEVYFGDVLGYSDSLKRFEVSYPNGVKSEIILSKNYGLIKFVPLEKLSIVNAGIPENYYQELVAFKNNSINTKYTAPDFLDYFDLNVGDLKYWKDMSLLPEGIISADMYRKDSFETVLRTNNEVIYTIVRSIYDSNFNLLNQKTVTEKYTRAKEGKIVQAQAQSFHKADWDGSYDEVYMIANKYRTINELDTNTFVEYSRAPFSLWDGQINERADDGFGLQIYSTKVGLVYSKLGGDVEVIGNITEPYPLESTVIGTSINGIKSGITAFISTGVPNFELDHTILYPNPAKNIVNIQPGINTISNISIFNTAGVKVHESSFASFIDVSAWINGVYTVVITDDNNFKHLSKLIKN